MKLSEIPILGSKFWKELGGKIPFWVKDDALKGLMQDNKKGLRYRSRQYVKYKANRFERFTNRTGSKGTKIKAFRGVPIESNQTSFVDLTATGKMLNSLKPKSAGDNFVIMAFSPDQAGKVLGNKRYGYNIIGLNDKNKELVKDLIVAEMNKRKIELPKKLIVNVSV